MRRLLGSLIINPMKRFTDRDIKILENRHFGASHVIPPARKPMDHEESRNQIMIMRWWRWACITHSIPEHLLMAFPLQGARTPRNGARMKREGCRKGTLDMHLAVARGKCHGLWIELKTDIGVASKEQKSMMADLLEQGYAVRLCRSAGEVTKLLGEYIRGENITP